MKQYHINTQIKEITLQLSVFSMMIYYWKPWRKKKVVCSNLKGVGVAWQPRLWGNSGHDRK